MKKQTILLLIGLSLINSIGASHESSDIKNDWLPPLKTKFEELSQGCNPYERLCFTPEKIRDLEFVFKTSPRRAQNVVEQLKNKSESQFTLFFGRSGTGKTDMAQAIAYKMMKEGWSTHFIPSMYLVTTSDARTLENLKKQLEYITTHNNKVLIIIDDIDGLFDSCSDSKLLVEYFNHFLDVNQNNPNIHVIATLSEQGRLPQKLEQKIGHRRIRFNSF
ncbi:MAG: AAA family ATPase [Candidatus Dependentiae bacterium]